MHYGHRKYLHAVKILGEVLNGETSPVGPVTHPPTETFACLTATQTL